MDTKKIHNDNTTTNNDDDGVVVSSSSAVAAAADDQKKKKKKKGGGGGKNNQKNKSSVAFVLDDEEKKEEEEEDDSGIKTSKTKTTAVYVAYDRAMEKHKPLKWKKPATFPATAEDVVEHEDYPYENPERTRLVYEMLVEKFGVVVAGEGGGVDGGGTARRPLRRSGRRRAAAVDDGANGTKAAGLIQLKIVPATEAEITLAHTAEHYEALEETATMSIEELQDKCTEDGDLYYCPDTFAAAQLAVGGVLTCLRAVVATSNAPPTAAAAAGTGTTAATPTASNRAVALVRPPGHHACCDKGSGFCFFNGVAVAAKYAKRHLDGIRRVCIVDWDVHHGDGTSSLTYDDPDVLFVSLHRYAAGFFPGTGKPKDVGVDDGVGFNVNVGFTKGGMGNAEYAAAFSEIVLPLICSYRPDLLLVSCGFDAADGDLIGDCCLTPDFYGAMTRSLLEAVGRNVPVVVATEGGYALQNLTAWYVRVELLWKRLRAV